MRENSLSLVVHGAVCIGLAVLMYSVSYFVIPRKLDLEKLGSYECGFEPFEDSRARFSVRFYLVAILFVVFDLEVSFLFPWVVVSGEVGFYGNFVIMFFLLILSLGFSYEWGMGVLRWLC